MPAITDHTRSSTIWRSVLALLAGAAVGTALSLGTDEILQSLKVYPPWGYPVPGPILGLAAVYRAVYGVLGAYVIARIAPRRPMLHAMMAGVLGLVVSAAGAIATWQAGAAYGPHWYPVSLVLTALPAAWLGAKLYLSRAAARDASGV